MNKVQRKISFMGMINTILAMIVLVLWLGVFVVHGMVGVVSWTLLKLVLVPVGFVLFLVGIIALTVLGIRKKSIFKIGIFIGISLVYVFPILMLVNIIPMAYPAKLEHALPSVTIQSPFKEPVLVGWGGDSVENNGPHVVWASERWAYDLVIEPQNIGSDRLEDYGIYDKELFAPIAGMVVAAYDEEKDVEPNIEEFLSMEGNHVYIRMDETHTYLLFNHLKENSVAVKVGDRIEIGDYIGKVGNSGSTSEPHLHIHHQRQDPTKMIHPTLAEGLPLFFYDGDLNATMPISRSIIESAFQVQ